MSPIEFAVGGKSFATIGGTVKLERLVVSNDGQRAFAVLETERLRLAADVNPRSLRVAHRPSADPLDGWLELRSARITEVGPDEMTLSFRLPGKFEPASPKSLAWVRCADVTLVSTGRPSAFGDEQLRSGVRTPVMKVPGGAVVGYLTGPAPRRVSGDGRLRAVELPDIKRLDERAGYVRVRVASESAAVVGWIAKSALDKDRPVAGLLGMLSGGALGGGEGSIVCDRDVDVLVDGPSGRVRVGALRAHKSVPGKAGKNGGLQLELEYGLAFAAVFLEATAEDAKERLHPYVAPEDAPACQLRNGS